MKLAEIVNIIDGTVFNSNQNLEMEIKGGCGADLMSDVLASVQPDAVLLTGLCNPQVVRTAQMADVQAIIFVRGKQPNKETIQLAEQEEMPLISSPYGMFELCGRLYQAGLPSLETNMQHTNGG
jgi:predicted transcriptional regulator